MEPSSVKSLLDAAERATGLDDFGDDWFMRPLGAWAADLQQPHLNEFGRGFLRSLAVRDLGRRLRVLQTLRQHPEVAEVAIPPIVYITGLERSGTTLLHNLLAQHPQARALLRWELMEPLPPPTTLLHAGDPRIASVQASIERLRGSMLEHMHWVNADEPEECVWGFIDAVSMLGQSPALCMPQWGRFLAEEDPTPAYARYRQLVQLLLWKHPVAPGGFLVLKAPQIAVHVAAFATVFPEAHFVVTHRDPFRSLVSMATLGHAIIAPFCVDNPLADDGARSGQLLSRLGLKLAALDAFTTAQPRRIEHVAYPSLVSQPVETVQRVLSALGIASGDDVARRVEAYLQAQQAGALAAPPPELASMGYGHEAVLADPVVAGYCRRFGVEPERSRLTGGSAPAVPRAAR